jgi:hypothetical protein
MNSGAAFSPTASIEMRLVRLLTVGLSLALLPVGLAAQNVPSPYRFLETRHSPGLFAGYLMTDPGDLNFGPHEAALFGARYGLHLTGPLTVEGSLGFSPTQRTLYARTATGSGDALANLGDVDALLLIADASLKLHVTGARAWRGLAPFGVISGGLAADLASADPRESALAEEQRFDFGPSFAASIGLGTDFFLTERLSLRAEARDYLWRFSYPAGLTETGDAETDWTNNYAVTLGAALHF